MKILLVAAALAAQSVVGQVNSRVAEIEADRDKKARELKPEELNKLEQRLLWIKEGKILERVSAGIYGFRMKMGGMATGEGFALGPEYLRADLKRGEVVVRGAAQISTKGSTQFEAQFQLPSFAGDRLFADIYAVRHNYGSIQYYGPGPDSQKTGRSNFRYEDVALDGLLGVNLGKRLKVGGSAGALWVNVGPGDDRRFASADDIYNPTQAPGIQQQTNFARTGAFAQFDYRDSEIGPRSGGNYIVRYDFYNDLQLQRFGFHELGVELQQYVPFFNERRVFLLRGKTTLTKPPDGEIVPFYMQPVVGGSDDLRGFRPYRFRDNNSIVLNAEYRFETFAGLDTAIFADGGKVFPNYRQFNFANLEGSVGFGLRFNVRNAIFLRIDVGFSHEGYMIWVKFGGPMRKRPLGRSSPESIF